MEIILNYMYIRDTSDITFENVFEVYCSADYLCVIGLTLACQKFIMEKIRIENCVGVMLFARNRINHKLEDDARFYILVNFLEVSLKSQQFFELDVNDLFSILNDDLLNAKDEQTVWECVVKWIDVDPEKRKHHVIKLLSGIRLGLLHTTVSTKRILYKSFCS